MKILLRLLTVYFVVGLTVRGYDGSVGGEANDDWSARHWSQTDGSMENAFFVSLGNSETYMNVRYDVVETVTAVGISLSVRDEGSPKTFPMVGLFKPNLRVDQHGNTPDLTSPLSIATDPGLLCGPDLDFWSVRFPKVVLPAGSIVHVVVQFPSPSTGLLAIGADTDIHGRHGGEFVGSPNPVDSSYYSSQQYAFPARPFVEGELGLNLLLDESEQGGTILRAFRSESDCTGDFERLTVKPNHEVGLGIWAEKHAGSVTHSRLYLSSHGVPILPIGSVFALEQGTRAHRRIISKWPLGFGKSRLTIVAVSASPSVPGSVRVSNEITLESLPDPDDRFGARDDGTYEHGWAGSYPFAGPEDYFNVHFGDGQHHTIEAMAISVMDFGTWETGYPRVGITSANDTLDPSGQTPDLSNPYVDIQVPFPALTLCTTVGHMIETLIDPFQPVTADTHMFLQHPPGAKYLGVGADEDGESFGVSGYSFDAFRTRAKYRFIEANWGMRLLTQ